MGPISMQNLIGHFNLSLEIGKEKLYFKAAVRNNTILNIAIFWFLN